MIATDYRRPATLAEALALCAPAEATAWLAGGQSLIAAMKLGLASPERLVDLQDVPGLRGIRVDAAADGTQALWDRRDDHAREHRRSDTVRGFAPG